MDPLVIAESRGLEDHGARLRAQHGQATVDDDSLVGRKTDHRARLYDDLIGHADGVGAGEGLRARPGGLGATLRFLNRLLRLPTKLCWGGRCASPAEGETAGRGTRLSSPWHLGSYAKANRCPSSKVPPDVTVEIVQEPIRPDLESSD